MSHDANPTTRARGHRLLALTLLSACHTPIPVAPRVQPIVGGTRDLDDPAVVLIGGFTAGGRSTNVCTSFVVSPHVVVTAAHCFEASL
jgi:hypothetical protein